MLWNLGSYISSLHLQLIYKDLRFSIFPQGYMASQISMHKSPLVGLLSPKHRASDPLRLVQGPIICISNGS